MEHYSTDRVAGDTATPVEHVKMGDIVRLYIGIADAGTVTKVEHGIRQGLRRVVRIHVDAWGQPMEHAYGETLDLATGGPRESLS